MKWMNMKTRDTRRVREKPSAYAKPHAIDVRSIKKDNKYVKAGSGRWYVFLVSKNCQMFCNGLWARAPTFLITG